MIVAGVCFSLFAVREILPLISASPFPWVTKLSRWLPLCCWGCDWVQPNTKRRLVRPGPTGKYKAHRSEDSKIWMSREDRGNRVGPLSLAISPSVPTQPTSNSSSSCILDATKTQVFKCPFSIQVSYKAQPTTINEALSNSHPPLLTHSFSLAISDNLFENSDSLSQFLTISLTISISDNPAISQTISGSLSLAPPPTFSLRHQAKTGIEFPGSNLYF